MSSAHDSTRRIYLDNAATSWPKPAAVYEAVDRYQRTCGVAAGRGAYGDAIQLQRSIDAARSGIADLLGAGDSRRVVWTANATDSLNLAIHGYLRPGDHVVTTDLEHNSVIRPLSCLQERSGARVDFVECDHSGIVSVDALDEAIRPETRLLVVNHASNVTGAVQSLAAIAELAHDRQICLLVDAAQTLGQIPWTAPLRGRLLVAGAGHKSLLGPLGLGWLYVSPGLEGELEPLRQGGTGTQSEDDRQPSSLPDRYEAGNLNVPAIVGLAAGLAYLRDQGIESIAQHHGRLIHQLRAGLARIPGVTVFGPPDDASTVGVVSCVAEGLDPHELATILDASFGIQVRAGLHCAPRIHQRLGTVSTGGTLRMSVGCWTTEEHIETTLEALRSILAC